MRYASIRWAVENSQKIWHTLVSQLHEKEKATSYPKTFL